MFMFIFQESGLMDVRGNDGVFPLSKLAMLGKTIINKTIVSLGVGHLFLVLEDCFQVPDQKN